MKAPGEYPTNGIDIGTGNPAELFILVSEVDASDSTGLRVSIGFPSLPPTEQLIVSSPEAGFDCKNSDGDVMSNGCQKFLLA